MSRYYYVDGQYTPVSVGQTYWTAQYLWSKGTLKLTKKRSPTKVVIDSDGYIRDVPGNKGRKLPHWYYGYLFTSEKLAEDYIHDTQAEHLAAFSDKIESLTEALQFLCKKTPGLDSTRSFNDIKQTFLKYAQIL